VSILLVDIGNTRLRWCRADGGRCTTAVVREYNKADAAAAVLDDWVQLTAPRRVVVSNVAGAAVQDAVTGATHTLWSLAPEFVKARAGACGVTNGYRHPERLGPDRWAAMIAAHRLFPGPKYIVDCGTATTVDVLDGEGKHLGGLILPGLTMMRRALLSGTSDLTLNEEAPAARKTLLANETSDAIHGGTLYMLIAALDRIGQDVAAELPGDLVRVVTGGDAPLLLTLLAGEHSHEPDLVLKGLLYIAGETP
jgi:type III pantothenate kinase